MAKKNKAELKRPIAKSSTNNTSAFFLKDTFSLIVFGLAFLLFANSIFNGYNLDDELVTRNHRLTSKGISAIPEIFTSPYYQDEQGYAYEYRPVVLATFAIEHSFFGDSALAGHFINVLLYAICCVVLLKVLKKLLPGFGIIVPLAITLLFLAHASHTEVVCSIKNRDELLALLFALLTLRTAIHFTETKQWWLVLVAGLFFTLGLMSKNTIISFALLIPLSLVIFTAYNTWHVYIVTIILLLPSYLLLNIGTGYNRLKIVAGIFFLVSLFIGFARYKAILQWLRNFINTITEKTGEDNTERSNYGSHSLLLPKLQLPSKTIVKPLPVALALALSILYALFVAGNFTTWAIVPFVMLCFLYWRGNEAISWFAFLGICFCLTYNCAFITPQYGYREKYLSLLYPFFGLITFHSSGSVMSIGILALISLLPFTPTLVSLWDGVSTVFAMFLLRIKYVRFILLGIVLFFIVAPTLLNGQTADILSYILFSIGIVTILCLQFRPAWFKSVLWIFAIAGLGYFMVLKYQSDSNLLNTGINTITETANRVNPQIITKQDRPLHFTEQCVTGNDPLTVRVGTSLSILFHYLKKTLLPYPLAYYYGYKFIKPQKVTDIIPMASLIVYTILFFTAVYLTTKDPIVSFGLFTYLISVLVFSDYIQYVPGMVADRYLLVPTLGWSIVVVGVLRKFSGVSDTAKKVNWASVRPAVRYAFMVLLFLYSALTFARNFNWKDDLTLFRHDIEYVNESAQAHNLLALHLMQYASKETNPSTQQQLAREALSHFKKAIEIYPPFFNVAYDIGRVYSFLNMPDSAIMAFENALAIDSSTLPNIYMQLSDLYLNKGNKQKAMEYTERYINLNKNDYGGYSRLSYFYFTDKKYAESIEVNRRAMAIIPNLVDPYINVAYTFREMKNTDSALYYLRLAEKIDPANANVQQSIKALTGIATLPQ
jgi:tetratricopeptide (TPR) repeat protein